MDRKDKRRHERLETNVKVKLPGDTTWIECIASNISASGLFFAAARQLNVGVFVDFQFMVQPTSGSLPNVHFFASGQVVRIIPKADIYQIAIEFIFDDNMRKEWITPQLATRYFGKIKSE